MLTLQAELGRRLWRSTDDGRTWRQAGPLRGFTDLAFDAGDAQRIAATVRVPGGNFLYVSANGGASWRRALPGHVGEDVEADAVTPGVLVVDGAVPRRSTNFGRTFTARPNAFGFEHRQLVGKVDVGQVANPSVNRRPGLFRNVPNHAVVSSADGGRSWTVLDVPAKVRERQVDVGATVLLAQGQDTDLLRSPLPTAHARLLSPPRLVGSTKVGKKARCVGARFAGATASTTADRPARRRPPRRRQWLHGAAPRRAAHLVPHRRAHARRPRVRELGAGQGGLPPDRRRRRRGRGLSRGLRRAAYRALSRVFGPRRQAGAMHRHPHHHDDEVDDHDRGLAFDLQTLISRRQALRVIAGGALSGIGLIALAGCGSEDPGDAAATTSSAAATTSATTATVACGTTIPEETAGPYPGDGSNGVNVLAESGIVRSDIRSSFGDASGVAEGVPLTVTLTVVDNANGCVPLTGAAVYLWHCDRDGQYSMYADAIKDENYLRGVQETDANGNVTFTTIFPAAYSGRWPHIHFEVYPTVDDATAGTNLRATSQLALPRGRVQRGVRDGRVRAERAEPRAELARRATWCSATATTRSSRP